MLLKSMMKNPVLMVGFLFLAIFLFQLRDQGIFSKRAKRMIATSCKSVKARLTKYTHKSWKLECDGNNLAVEVPVDKKVISPDLKNIKELKPKMYKLLANIYNSISRYSPPDSLERTMIISVRLKHNYLTLNSISEGKHVYNLKTIKNPKNLAKHIQGTIQVQEVIRK